MENLLAVDIKLPLAVDKPQAAREQGGIAAARRRMAVRLQNCERASTYNDWADRQGKAYVASVAFCG